MSSLHPVLRSLLRHAIRLHHTETAAEPSIGASKLGGRPHLPKDFTWPTYEGEDFSGETAARPLSFIAQIDLAAASVFDADDLLPKSGYLYFFYDLETQKWGFDPKDAGCARVYYVDLPAADLVVTDLPSDLDDEYRVPLSLISFDTMTDLPGYEEFCELVDIDSLDEDVDWDAYDEAAGEQIELLDTDPAEVCKLLGYADLIQGSMLDQCARVTAGYYCGSPEAYRQITPLQSAAIAADAKNWILLAQFGTLPGDIMFGDCGCIYFYIRKEDLSARRFDRVWLILQCG